MNRDDELMHGLADGELSDTEAAEARALLDSHESCRLEYQWAVSLKAALERHCPDIPNPEGWNACVGRLDQLDRSRGVEKFVGRYAWAFCAVLFALILFGGVSNRLFGSKVVSGTQIASVLDPFGTGSAVSKDRMPDISAARQLNLRNFAVTSSVGGFVADRPFVRYGLRDANGLGGLAVVVLKGATRVEGLDKPTRNPGIRSGVFNDVQCVTWNVEDNTVLLFGERTGDELVTLAEQMAQ